MEGKNSMIGFKECVRTLVADRVYYLTTERIRLKTLMNTHGSVRTYKSAYHY